MSFRTKTIFGIALIQAILLGILVIVGLRWMHDSNEDLFVQRADALVNLYASNIKDALLASDLEKLNTIAQESTTNRGLEYLRITNNHGLVLIGVGDTRLLQNSFALDEAPSKVVDGIYDTGADVVVEGISYGRIELGLSVKGFQSQLNEARSFGIGIAGLSILLVALFSYVLGTYLTGQLSGLTRASEKIGAEGPGFKLPIRGNDELAKVSIAFNHMSESLAATYRQLHENAESYRQVSKRLTESDATKSAILSATLDGVVTIDVEGTIIDFNKAAETIFGYRSEEALGREMSTLIIPEAYREAHLKGMEHWKKTGEGPVLDTRLELLAMHKDGSEFPIEVSITPIEIMDKTLFTAFVRDITDQKSVENELKLAASTFDSHEAIFITDNKSRIMRVNKAFCEITGYTEEEAVNHTPGELIKSGMHDDDFYQTIWSSLEAMGKWEGEINNRRKNGEIFPEWVSITAVKGNNGETTHYVAHAIDITEQKRHESELREAREQAELASVAKSQFLANMSHEIRTPLNAVINLNSLLMDTPLNEQQKKLLSGAFEGGKTLATLVDDILDYTKIEANKIELECEPFSLEGLLKQLTTLFNVQAKAKKLDFQVDHTDGVPATVLGDEQRIRQILVNLIGNAIKFTVQGSVRLIVSHDMNNQVLFEVADTGIGIKADDQSRLFDEFSQADTSTTRKYGGTGLGLSISKSLVKLMKGEIGCRNNDPQGSIFWFRIPMESIQIRPEQKHLEAEKLSDARILVAEDSLANQVVVKALLENQGCHVTLVNNGSEAVEMMRNFSFDLILMDVMMPEMDGIEATMKIRRNETGASHTPIIALTANVFSEDRERCLQAGMDDFVAKPIDSNKLRQQMVKWILHAPLQAQENEAMRSEIDLMSQETLDKLGQETSPEILPEIVNVFIDEMQERIDQFPSDISALDADDLVSRAHAIKSSAGTFGANRLMEAARDIEQLARDGEIDQARSQISSMLETGRSTLVTYRHHYVTDNTSATEA